MDIDNIVSTYKAKQISTMPRGEVGTSEHVDNTTDILGAGSGRMNKAIQAPKVTDLNGLPLPHSTSCSHNRGWQTTSACPGMHIVALQDRAPLSLQQFS